VVLPAPFSPDQRVNLGRARLEIDTVERQRASEAFAYGGGA